MSTRRSKNPLQIYGIPLSYKHVMLASDFDRFVWMFPWQAISRAARDAYELELQIELCPEHMLYGCKATAIGRTSNGDDILFLIHNNPTVLAVVHLTFVGRQEPNPLWPTIRFFESIEDWRRLVFLPDTVKYKDANAKKIA